MKQVGLGMMQYLQDYDETFPRLYGNQWNFSSVTSPDPDTGYYASESSGTGTHPQMWTVE